MIAIQEKNGPLRWFHPDSIRQLTVNQDHTTTVLIAHPGQPFERYVTERRAIDIANDCLWSRVNHLPTLSDKDT